MDRGRRAERRRRAAVLAGKRLGERPLCHRPAGDNGRALPQHRAVHLSASGRHLQDCFAPEAIHDPGWQRDDDRLGGGHRLLLGAN